MLLTTHGNGPELIASKIHRDFVRQFAPQLAYANPALPMTVERIPDPRNPSRKPGAGQIAHWPGGAVPPTEVTVDFRMSAFQLRMIS